MPLRGNREFTRFWVGETLSAFGSRMSYVAYPLLVLALTGSASKAGLVTFLKLLPWLLFGLLGGLLVDRANRKYVMLVCDAGGCLALGSLVVALALGVLSFAQVLVVAFVEGLFSMFFEIAEAPVLRRLVPAEQLSDAVAQNQAREMGALLAGPPVGGFLFGLGRLLPFLGDAASYLVSALALVSIRTPFQAETRPPPTGGFLHELRQGLVWLWREPFLRMSELLVSGGNFITNGVVLALIVIARRQGASGTVVGGMLAVVAVGGLLGALAAPRLQRRVSDRLIVVSYAWLTAAIVFALAATPPALVLGALLGVLTFFGPLWDAIIVGYRLRIVPDHLQGRVQSAAAMIAFSTPALGPLAAGFALDHLGAGQTLALFGGLALALALIALTSKAVRTTDLGAARRESAPAGQEQTQG